MNRIFNLFVTCLGLSALCNASVLLRLDNPTGAISGVPGSTIGWGFALSSPADFAVISSSSFCLGASGVTNACVAPALGTYSDYIASNFTIAGPAPESPVVTQAFDATSSTGLGSFTIQGAAPTGTTDTGQIVVTYDLYSVDPLASNFDPIADLLSTGNYLVDPASVTVSSVVATPEPKYTVLLGVLLAMSVLAVRRHRRKIKMAQKFNFRIAWLLFGLFAIVFAISAQQRPDLNW